MWMREMKTRRAVTQEERDYIAANDGSMTVQALADSMGRPKSTIDKLRKSMRIRKDDKRPWTEEELELLKDNNHLSNKELAELFPSRTYGSIAGARKTNNLRMVRTCAMCESTFISQYSNTKVCESCNPSGKRNNKNPLVRYAHYREGALTRNLAFELEPKEFMQFWQKSCSYCGSEIETIGLDRIDASKGYTTDNVTPCCSRCNEMKLADSVDTWLSHMKKVIQHMENNHG